MQNATIGLDLAKHVFQVHDVADDGKVVRPVDLRCAPFATKSVRRCSTSLSATRRHPRTIIAGPDSCEADETWPAT